MKQHLLVKSRVCALVWCGNSTTHGGSQVWSNQTRAQTDRHPKAVNKGQPYVVSLEGVQEQVVWDAPSIVLDIIPIVAAVMRLLNVLEVLVPNHGRLQVLKLLQTHKHKFI